MEIRLLGPVELCSERGPVPIGSGKQRALLAFLALHPQRLLTYDALIDGLWGHEQPDATVEALRFHVSRLRGILRQVDDADRLRTRPGGYQLVLDDDAVDVLRFEKAIAGARLARSEGAAPEVVSRAFRDGLDLWVGTALADINGEPFVVGERRRLEELRLAATEDYFAAELAVGRHSEAIAELERMVDSHPLRERFWELLIIALYRSDRQADALAAYQRVRRILADELGLEPSARLKVLEHRVLVQDTGLARLPATSSEAVWHSNGDEPPTVPADELPPHPEATGRRSRWLATGALVLGVVALALFWLGVASILIALVAVLCGAIAARRTPEGNGRARWVALAAIITGAVALSASSGLVVYQHLTADDEIAVRTEQPDEGPAASTPEPAGSRVLPLSSLHIGHCFNIRSSGLPDPVLVVPCDEPHHAEVYHFFMLVPGPYPGYAEVEALAVDQCATAFERYVGVPREQSELDFRYRRPMRSQWEAGERGGGCALIDASGGRLTGSMLGERR
jgi:DNA-binding SARP family transcriptional activator